ncbi:DUF6527 family protein [Flexivirga sp.]|uniref:DUF6527 family protein n=1 Tax=Flexivirga sp. TaxID=1962927 RepID=UPI003F81AD0F
MIVRVDGDHVFLWCPGCDALHMVSTGPNGWAFDGNTERPTLSPSLLVKAVQWPDGEGPEPTGAKRRDRHPNITPGEHTACHSFVRDGQWQFLPDSTHHLAGQTVPCVPIPDGWFN